MSGSLKKIFFTLSMLAIFLVSVKSQNYLTGVGIRLGSFNGFTVKHFMNSKSALKVFFHSDGADLSLPGCMNTSNL